MTQFDEGKGYEGIRIKIFEFENARSDIKKCCSHRKTEDNVRHTTQEHLPTKVTPVIDLKNEPVIQCDLPVIENNIVDDCK